MTDSFPVGTAAAFGAVGVGSGTFVVADLNAASAADREAVNVRRDLSAILLSLPQPHGLSIQSFPLMLNRSRSAWANPIKAAAEAKLATSFCIRFQAGKVSALFGERSDE